MKLPKYVKSKTWIGDYIPVLGNATSQTIYPFIFLSKKAYDNLKSDKASPIFLAHLTHEEVHLKRQKEQGSFLWIIKHLLQPKFRFNEELIAYNAQMSVYKKNKLQFNSENTANALSGSLYLWAVKKAYAKKELENAWEKA